VSLNQGVGARPIIFDPPWVKSGTHSQPAGFWTDGRNSFLYHRPKQPGARMLCEFGFAVACTFEKAGEVYATETRRVEAAVAVHRRALQSHERGVQRDRQMDCSKPEGIRRHSWDIY
jgi:hypothetical protein